jgi:long-chain acyl-CoA synthetase
MSAQIPSLRRLFELPAYQLQNYNRSKALNYKRQQRWVHYSSHDLHSITDRVAAGLLEIGLEPGDRVATIANNRPEWNFIDLGAMKAGLVHVPLYTNSTRNDLGHILRDSHARAVFAETPDLVQKIYRVVAEHSLNDLQYIYAFSEEAEAPFWERIFQNPELYRERLQQIQQAVAEDDLATLIYTSGTTGYPKGVRLSHRNIVSNIKGCFFLLPDYDPVRTLSFLPLSHIFERMVVYLYLYGGCEIYYAQNLGTVSEDLKDVRPHLFTTVPRMLEKIYEKIERQGRQLKGAKRKLFDWSISLGLRYDPQNPGPPLYRAQLALARKLVFSKWQAALGGALYGIVSGGAALQPRLARLFWAAGIPVVEGYGLTETSPVIAVNDFQPEGCRIGSVGRPIEPCEVRIEADGEILVRGQGIMQGYYHLPETNEEVFTSDGFFRTGDIGHLDKDSFLHITDRKREVFKTASGKFVAPQLLENKLKESPLIEQVMVLGNGMPFPTALIVPNWDFAVEWYQRQGYQVPSTEEMIADQRLNARVREEVDRYNRYFAPHERVIRFRLLPSEWTVEGGELTPTVKLKRRNVLSKYKAVIEEMYQ